MTVNYYNVEVKLICIYWIIKNFSVTCQLYIILSNAAGMQCNIF